jgi:hypothetical protein
LQPDGARAVQHLVRQPVGLEIADHDQEPLRPGQRPDDGGTILCATIKEAGDGWTVHTFPARFG